MVAQDLARLLVRFGEDSPDLGVDALRCLFGVVPAFGWKRTFQERRVPVARTLVGNYVTSLDMAGCSVSICQADEELLRLWDAPVATPALRWGC